MPPSDVNEPPGADDPGLPRWVKFLGLIAIALLGVFIVAHLSGHHPGHHHPGGEPAKPAVSRPAP